MKHKHIPFGNGHITMVGDNEPTEEMIQAFKEIAKLALSLPLVNCQREQLICTKGIENCNYASKDLFTCKMIRNCDKCAN